MLQAGWIIRDLIDPDDRPALRDFYNHTQDYIILETGLVPSDATIDELFQNAPPGGDPAECILLGLFDDQGAIQGVCEQSFGYPNPDSSYLGLLILSPELRGSGYGPILFERMKTTAIKKTAANYLSRYWRRTSADAHFGNAWVSHMNSALIRSQRAWQHIYATDLVWT